MQKFNFINNFDSKYYNFINFVDYNPKELTKIFELMCQDNGYIIDHQVIEKGLNLLLEFQSKIGELGNSRFVRNIFDRCIANQCNRLAALPNPTKEDLITFQIKDVI